ncbi:type II and III secretion system protein family protein [Sphingomonas sp. ID0503]|uniref:type II and III secretion system protein family protein n=1 Tax=Sphingomonas sp. ID0503 TaxID=3399691 RepID=UPI003AFAE135
MRNILLLSTCCAASVALAAPVPNAPPADAAAAIRTAKPTISFTLSTGTGQIVKLPRPVTDVMIANDQIADVQVQSPTQIYVYGKGTGQTTIYATDKSGAVVYGAEVQVAPNYAKLGELLHAVMPESQIVAVPMAGVVLLKGNVDTPQEIQEAVAIVQQFVGKDVPVINHIKTALPQQVMLRVRIAEVSRAFSKSIGLNLLSRDTTGGKFLFGIAQGNATAFKLNAQGAIEGIVGAATGSTIGGVANIAGIDIGAALDLAETDGFATTLAEPNLTALSGETASFLAGGEIPIPVPQVGNGGSSITIEYKQYGVSLSFTPVVMSAGRISMRVRPEVSELTESTVSISGYSIPGLNTRRAETTVELGSGQSFVIGGLLSNRNRNSQTKAPFLGDIPVLGALFKSTRFQRDETELMIVVTPYLVKPLPDAKVALPSDGYRAPNDGERIWEHQTFKGVSGTKPTGPTAGSIAK